MTDTVARHLQAVLRLAAANVSVWDGYAIPLLAVVAAGALSLAAALYLGPE